MRQIRDELTAAVGGAPTAAQRMLIDRAAVLALRLAQFDARMLQGGDVQDNTYLAWANSLRRTLVALGVDQQAPAAETPSLNQYLSARYGAGAAV